MNNEDNESARDQEMIARFQDEYRKMCVRYGVMALSDRTRVWVLKGSSKPGVESKLNTVYMGRW